MESVQNERIKTLLSWRDQARAELAELRKRQAEVEEEVSKKDSQLRNIIALLKSEGYAGGPGMASETRSGGSIADYAYSLLHDSGKPTYYKNLAAKILEAGITIPGRDPAANLLSHMGRDDRFKRVKRGTYALAEWNVKASIKPHRRKRRRQR